MLLPVSLCLARFTGRNAEHKRQKGIGTRPQNNFVPIGNDGFGLSGFRHTTTAHGRLMLTVLGGLAEFERELVRARTGEGREGAKARDVKMGRRPKLTDHQKRGDPAS
jgi:Resolvase, N terminal domain